MKKLFAFAGTLIAVGLAPSVALAQLPIDPTASPTKDLGGPLPWAATWGIFGFGVLLVAVVVAGYMRWAPKWMERKQEAAAAGPAPVRTAPPALAPPIPPPVAAAAAAASADAIGEKRPDPPAAAVAVLDEPTAPAAVSAAPVVAPGGGDVYETTLNELLAKGVPQKVAEARAKVAAKKAGG